MAKDDHGTSGISLDRAIAEVATYVEDAEDFLSSELEGDWDRAERYYNGETDLEIVENRSSVAKTEIRDSILNTMPSVMRVLLQARKIVEYEATSMAHAAWVEQQSEWIARQFMADGGYMTLYSTIMEALKLKKGIIKTFWEPDPLSTYESYTKVSYDMVEMLIADPLFEVEDFELVETDIGPEVYDVSGYRIRENGQIIDECTPNYEFFITRNCNSIEDAKRRGVHGQSGLTTVSEAMDMGLEYDNWIELDYEDPEESDHTSSSASRRGYQKQREQESLDVLNHEFRLTEAYISYDLKGTGRSQLYCFMLGGSSHKYLDHWEVEDSPYSIMTPLPIPHTVHGHSYADLGYESQDVGTSILRATVDNVHASNGAKFVADPEKTNFDDLMNQAINAPVRNRNNGVVQTIQIPSMAQANLGLLGYLDQDVQDKYGTTKASQGLDPDAMQSTDKNAVMNTIMTGEGRTELIVRNMIETCLIRVFKLRLRLSVRHMSPIQMMKTKGQNIPIDITNFDPDACAVPAVGLGTASPQQRVAALGMVMQRQEMYMEKFGPNNPFTSYVQMYNTQEDILDAQGIHNTARYFNVVTPGVEKAWAEAQQKQAQEAAAKAAQNAPMDPSKAYIEVENIKAQTKSMEVAANTGDAADKLRVDALDKGEKNDIARDKLAQDRVIAFTQLGDEAASKKTKAEQDASVPKSANSSSKKST